MIRTIRIAAAVALLCMTSGCATSYGGSNAGGLFGGQKVSRLAPDRWQVTASSNGYSPREYSRNTALYKAGLVARALGMRYIQIYDFNITTNQYGAESAVLRMRPTANPVIPYLCESKPFFRGNCRTLPVDETISHYGAAIQRTEEQSAAEVAAVRTQFGLAPPTEAELRAQAERERAAAGARLQRPEGPDEAHLEAQALARATGARKGDTRTAAAEKKSRWETIAEAKLPAGSKGR